MVHDNWGMGMGAIRAGRSMRRAGYVVLALAAMFAATIVRTAPRARALVPSAADWSEAYFPSGDGTILHADVLRPKGAPEMQRTPVLLVVTPYNPHGGPADGADPTQQGPVAYVHYLENMRAWARGYSVVIVDLPGFGASGGCWDAGGPREQAAAKAAVEWSASRPWSTGKVGMMGGSYDGWTQIMALATHPRGLAAVDAEAPVVTLYDSLYDNGVRHWMDLFWWPSYHGAYNNQPGTIHDAPGYHEQWLAHATCPGVDTLSAYDRDRTSQFWRDRDLLARASSSDIPVSGSQGFLDFNVAPAQSLRLFSALPNRRHLWVGQFAHDFSQPDHRGNDDASFRFFDEVLLGKEAPAADPRVAVQQAPDLRWRSETQWPPADARPFGMPVRPGTYLDTAGNTSGDSVWEGTTAKVLPGQVIPAEKEPLSGRGAWTFTQPLSSEVHLSGNPQLHVNAVGPPNAHVVSLLYDVSPDGNALLITRGASLLGAGSVDITLHPQDWVIAPGHRIGLLLSGADDSWYVPGENSGQLVQVHGGRLDVPALTQARTAFLDYPAGERFAQVKHPIHIDQATIGNRTEARR